MAGKYSTTIYQGSDFSRVITVVNTDLTGSTFRGKVKQYITDPTELVSLTFVITDAVNGKVTMSLTDVQTAALPAGNLYYDVEWVQAGGDIMRLLQGVFDVDPEVTT